MRLRLPGKVAKAGQCPQIESFDGWRGFKVFNLNGFQLCDWPWNLDWRGFKVFNLKGFSALSVTELETLTEEVSKVFNLKGFQLCQWLNLKPWLKRKAEEPKPSELTELCKSRDGRPGISVPNKPYDFCAREATPSQQFSELTELCKSRGGRPGLPSLISLIVHVKQHSTNSFWAHGAV